MPQPIPSAGEIHRYRLAQADEAGHRVVTLADALRALSDDILETGDARVALERAFWWGYQHDDGSIVPGLQDHIRELRRRREQLLKRTEDDAFLDAMKPELGRIDAIEGRAAEDQSSLERLADRMESGYDSREAQAEFDDLVSSLRQMAGKKSTIPSDQEADVSEARSLFQPSLSSRHARLDHIRRALFAGGMATDDKATGSWKIEDGEQRRSLTLDVETLLQIDELDRALRMLGTVGSVMALSAAEVERLSDDLPQGLASWLKDWAEAAGDLRRKRGGGSGTVRPSLPPAVISAIGKDLLRRLFRPAIVRVPGEHETRASGTSGDSDEASRSWEPGRPLDLNLVATLSNAIRREGPAGKGRIRLRPDDFEVVERTARIAMSTVLAIDRSRSMGQSGAWTSAKKLTIAMHELIRQSYHRDALSVLAFSSTAEAVAIGELPELHWDRFEHGTHLQAALVLGRRMLRQSSAASKQIVVITDGEPTIATTGSGETFASPPTAEVLEATMREVIRCTRERIFINMVILGGETGAATFAEQVARVNGGRILDASNEDLGTFILRDYLSR